jgi:hypothetical protein
MNITLQNPNQVDTSQKTTPQSPTSNDENENVSDGPKYYKKDRILRDLIWCWISIIVTVMLLTLVSKVHGGDMNNLEFMRNNQFVSVIMIVGSAQLVVAAGFLYLDKIKKTIGGPANTPENYEEWDEFMREQSKLDDCSNTKLWYIIPPIVLVTILLYNFIGIKNNYLWIILAVGVVIWIVTIIVTKVHTKYTCNQNKFFMDVHDKLTDKFKRTGTSITNCKMELQNKKEKCNSNIKNIHEEANRISHSPTVADPEDNSSSKGMTEFGKIAARHSAAAALLAKNPNFKGGGDVISVEKANCGDVGAGDNYNTYNMNDASKTKEEQQNICGYTENSCQDLMEQNGGNFAIVGIGPGGCYKYGNDYFFNNTSDDCTSKSDWPNRNPITQFSEICGYTENSCKDLTNKHGGNFNPVNNGPGGCYKYNKDYYFNKTSQDCTIQNDWPNRIPIAQFVSRPQPAPLPVPVQLM